MRVLIQLLMLSSLGVFGFLLWSFRQGGGDRRRFRLAVTAATVLGGSLLVLGCGSPEETTARTDDTTGTAVDSADENPAIPRSDEEATDAASVDPAATDVPGEPEPLPPPPPPPPAPLVACAVIQDMVPQEECDYYAQIKASLQTGEGAISAPSEMVRGEQTTVSFAVSRYPDRTSAEDVLGSAPGEDTSAEEFDLKVGRKMAALLQGEGFEIDPEGLVQKDLFFGDAARWEWKVTPVRAPRHRLTLTAYVVVSTPDGSNKENLLRTVTRDIRVTVPMGAQVQDFMDDSGSWFGRINAWLLLLAGLVSGGIFALWTALKAFRRPQSASGASPPSGTGRDKGEEEPPKS